MNKFTKWMGQLKIKWLWSIGQILDRFRHLLARWRKNLRTSNSRHGLLGIPRGHGSFQLRVGTCFPWFIEKLGRILEEVVELLHGRQCGFEGAVWALDSHYRGLNLYPLLSYSSFPNLGLLRCEIALPWHGCVRRRALLVSACLWGASRRFKESFFWGEDG